MFDHLVEVDVYDSKDAAHLAMLKRPELGVTFTKIHCWKLTQYHKCVFMDADTMVSSRWNLISFVFVMDTVNLSNRYMRNPR